jgi:Gpi18-like mannosyltransferase
MTVIVIWLSYRLITSIWAALLSAIKPVTGLEKVLPIWPPSPDLGTWVERTWLLPWQRWDAEWYLKIITSGYQSSDGTAQFHPLYAWLAHPLARIGIHPLLSLLLVSSLAALGYMYLFEALARLDLDPETARIATLLMVAYPSAFILFAPYTESLFLLSSAACFIFIRRSNWILAGLIGGLAALTRQQGIFLVFPLAWELWENSGREFKSLVKHWQAWPSIFGPAAGLATWFVYRAILLHDFNINTLDVKSWVYSGMISASAVKVVPVYKFTWPWQALWLGITHFLKSPDIDFLIDMGLAAIFVLLLALSWTRMRVSYRIFSVIITLVSFSYYTGPIHPYMGLPRHLFLAFPVFIGLAPTLVRQKHWLIYLGACLLGMLLLVAGYVLNGWVP